MSLVTQFLLWLVTLPCLGDDSGCHQDDDDDDDDEEDEDEADDACAVARDGDDMRRYPWFFWWWSWVLTISVYLECAWVRVLIP